jgi:signal transduction histidine kinase
VGYAADASLRGHFGMEIMRERAESIGGTLQVSSTVGLGTTVRICVPAGGPEAELGDLSSLRMA